MQPPLRIAILETDTPTPDFQAQYGSYGDCFIRLLSNAAMTLNPPLGPSDLLFTKWDVEQAEIYPDIDDVDAILIAGSKATAFESTPWIIKLTEFVRKALMEQDRVRVIGVCFGHQIVGRALGCVLERNQRGWEASITNVGLTEVGQKLFGRDHLSLMQLHRDHIVTLPVHPFPQLPNAKLEIIGDTDVSAVQGLYTPRKVITIQGHPEYDEGMMRYFIQRRAAVFGQEFATDALMRAGLRNDGTHVGATMLRFLLEPDMEL
ncbi:hypothetical protein ABW19_dt0206689 [Dactylella cylindrospora]|nr:hypothetical protein ABW19_dt0206689 [Dactylella cylindrospora]